MDTTSATTTSTVDLLLDRLGSHDIAGATALFATDAELVAPFSPPPLPPGARGRDAVGELLAMVFGGYGRVAFGDRRIVATSDPDVVLARWRTDIEVLASGRCYESEVIAVVELCDGLIVRFTEYFNPDALRRAGVI